MLTAISTLFYRISSWKTLLLAVIISMPFSTYFFENFEARINEQAGRPIGLIDALVGYDPARIAEMIGEYGARGRATYVQGELMLDIVYPFIYTLILGIALTLLFRHRTYTSFRLVNVLPVGILVFDLLENACIIYLLKIYPATSPVTTAFCSLLTNLKWTVTTIVIGLILYGLVKWAIRSSQKKLEHS